MSRKDRTSAHRGTDLNRRDFLTATGGAAAGAVVASALPAPAAATTAAAADYPVIDIASLDDLAPGTELAFEYPDPDSPAVLVRLEGAAEAASGRTTPSSPSRSCAPTRAVR